MTAAKKITLGVSEESTGAPLGHDTKNPKRDDKVTRMGTASIPALITEFAIPAIAGMLVNGAYNIIASIFLGQSMGEIGQAAMTVANPTMVLLIALGMLIGVGGNALAALRLGEGKRVEAERILGNTVLLSIIVAVIVAICALIPPVLEALITLSSSTDETRAYATSFVRIIAFGFVFQCIGMGVNNFIRTAGAPNRALLTMVIGAVACIILSYLFIIVLDWGVEGAAFAILLGQFASCVAVLWYFVVTKNVPMRLRLKYMKPKFAIMRQIISLGLASFFIQAGMALVGIVANHLVVMYGATSPLGADDALASIGVVQRIALFTLMPIFGISIAIQPLLGFNYGAQLISRVRKSFWYGVAGSVIIGVFMWIIVHVFPEVIANAFGIANEGAVAFTVFALKMQLMFLPIIGFQIIGSNYFQATGQPLKSILLTLSRQIIFLIPLMLVLTEYLPLLFPQLDHLESLCVSLPASDFLAALTTAIFILFEMKRLKKLERGEVKAKILSA